MSLVYRGLPVLDVLPWRALDAARSVAVDRPAGAAESDAGTATVLDLSDALPHADPAATFPLAWVCETRAEYATLRAFLDALRGRAGLFWCPSLQYDFAVLGAGGAANTTVVRSWGWAATFFPLARWKHLATYVRTSGGGVTVAAFAPSAATTGTDDALYGGAPTETLTASEITPTVRAAAVQNAALLCQLQAARLADDALDVEWLRGTACRVTASARWRPEEAP